MKSYAKNKKQEKKRENNGDEYSRRDVDIYKTNQKKNKLR